MACESIKERLAQNEQQRKDLAAQTGRAKDEAQRAYDAWQFHIVRPDQKFSEFWRGSYNGREFTDPYALEAYAKAQFEAADARYRELATQFNALFPIKDQLERDLQSCEAEQANTKENNSGTGTPGTAGEGEDASKPKTQEPPPVDGTGTGTGTGGGTGTGQGSPEKVAAGSDPGVKTGEGTTGIGAGEGTGAGTGEGTGEGNTNLGLDGAVDDARSQATIQDEVNFEQTPDWRVRLSLSPGAYYLYNDDENELLAPLRNTNGIIFPYTPTISVTYAANYQTNNPVHSNYKIFQYENSYVDSINISCDFTAQDTEQAKYLLAVIHFLRSATKMFYGQDQSPKPGTPPPLVYLFGMGEFQFNAHPMVISNFTMSLPNDVDYIRAGALTEAAGVNRGAPDASATKSTGMSVGQMLKDEALKRLGSGIAAVGNALGLKLQPGGLSQGYTFGMSNRFNATYPPGTIEPTYVPTKMNITISAFPVVSRYNVSNNFSVKDYANGSLLQGVKRKNAGFW